MSRLGHVEVKIETDMNNRQTEPNLKPLPEANGRHDYKLRRVGVIQLGKADMRPRMELAGWRGW